MGTEAVGSGSHVHSGSGATTLGDLLYADNTKLRVSEEYWIGLVRLVADGDQLAMHSLFEQAHRLVFTLAVRITGSPTVAEEVTLDVFHDVWRRSGSYDPAGGSVVGWIMNQARCRAIDRSRLEHRKKRVGNEGENPALPQGRKSGPEEACELEEKKRLLENALRELTAEERQVIETAFFSELTYNETAVRLNQPLGTVKTRIRSGLQKLRQALARDLR